MQKQWEWEFCDLSKPIYDKRAGIMQPLVLARSAALPLVAARALSRSCQETECVPQSRRCATDLLSLAFSSRQRSLSLYSLAFFLNQQSPLPLLSKSYSYTVAVRAVHNKFYV